MHVGLMDNEQWGFIFDLDGVIVDTARHHYLAWKVLAAKFGFDLTPEFNERLKGVDRMNSLQIILRAASIQMNEEDKINLAHEKNVYYLKSIEHLNQTDILPGVLDFILETKNLNIPIALGSASKNALHILEKLQLLDYFTAIVDGNQVKESKPDPEVFLLGSELISIQPNHCIVFEDSVKGIQAAQRAHMHTVGIGSPKDIGLADLVIPDFLSTKPMDIVQWFNLNKQLTNTSF